MVSCVVGALCKSGLLLPRDGAGATWFDGVGGASSGAAAAYSATPPSVDCYTLQDALLDFDGAAARCALLEDLVRGEGVGPGVLAPVHSQAQHDLVLALAQSLAPPTGLAIWIGLRKSAASGSGDAQGGARWVWVGDNTTLGDGSFSRWAAGEPDGRGWIDPWQESAFSQDMWWVTGNGASDGSGMPGAAAGTMRWEEATVRCGTPPPGGMSAAGAVVDGSLFVFGGLDAAARLSNHLTILQPMSASQVVARPVVTGLIPAAPRAPRQMLTVSGCNLCLPRADVRIGAHVCSESTSVSMHHITCQVPPGTGRNLAVTLLTAEGLREPAPVFFNYTPPLVATISPSSGRLDGGTSITVTGNSFGTLGSPRTIRIGGSKCLKQDWISDTALGCAVPPSYPLQNGLMAPLVVDVEGQSSAAGSDRRDYLYKDPVPQVTSMAPLSGPPVGAKTITMMGSNLDVLEAVAVGSSECVLLGAGSGYAGEASGAAARCRLVSVMGSGLAVKMRPRGTNATAPSLDTGFLFDADPPVLLGVLPGDTVAGAQGAEEDTPAVNKRFPASGASVHIVGYNFGWSTSAASVFIGASEAGNLRWISDRRLACTSAPGVGKNLEIRVHVAGQDAVSADARAPLTFSYDPPVITAVQPASLPLQGSGATSLLTIMGANFGEKALGGDAVVSVQGERGASVVVPQLYSNSKIVIMFAEGVVGGVAPPDPRTARGVRVAVVVSVAEQAGSWQVALVPSSKVAKLTLDAGAAAMRAADATHSSLRILIADIALAGAGSPPTSTSSPAPAATGARMPGTTSEITLDHVRVISVKSAPLRRWQARALPAHTPHAHAPHARFNGFFRVNHRRARSERRSRAGVTERLGGQEAALRSETLQVAVRFMSPLAQPEAGAEMLRQFARALQQCCSPRADDSHTFACDASAGAGSVEVCMKVASLGLQEVTFEAGALDAGENAGGEQAGEEVPDVEPGVGEGLSVPSWVVPAVSVGVAGLCLLAGVICLVQYEMDRRGDEGHDDDDDEEQEEALEKMEREDQRRGGEDEPASGSDDGTGGLGPKWLAVGAGERRRGNEEVAWGSSAGVQEGKADDEVSPFSLTVEVPAAAAAAAAEAAAACANVEHSGGSGRGAGAASAGVLGREVEEECGGAMTADLRAKKVTKKKSKREKGAADAPRRALDGGWGGTTKPATGDEGVSLSVGSRRRGDDTATLRSTQSGSAQGRARVVPNVGDGDASEERVLTAAQQEHEQGAKTNLLPLCLGDLESASSSTTRGHVSKDGARAGIAGEASGAGAGAVGRGPLPLSPNEAAATGEAPVEGGDMARGTSFLPLVVPPPRAPPRLEKEVSLLHPRADEREEAATSEDEAVSGGFETPAAAAAVLPAFSPGLCDGGRAEVLAPAAAVEREGEEDEADEREGGEAATAERGASGGEVDATDGDGQTAGGEEGGAAGAGEQEGADEYHESGRNGGLGDASAGADGSLIVPTGTSPFHEEERRRVGAAVAGEEEGEAEVSATRDAAASAPPALITKPRNLTPLPEPTSRDKKGRKLHSRQTAEGKPARPLAGSEEAPDPGKRADGPCTPASSAGDSPRRRGSWLDVLVQKYDASPSTDRKGPVAVRAPGAHPNDPTGLGLEPAETGVPRGKEESKNASATRTKQRRVALRSAAARGSGEAAHVREGMRSSPSSSSPSSGKSTPSSSGSVPKKKSPSFALLADESVGAPGSDTLESPRTVTMSSSPASRRATQRTPRARMKLATLLEGGAARQAAGSSALGGDSEISSLVRRLSPPPSPPTAGAGASALAAEEVKGNLGSVRKPAKDKDGVRAKRPPALSLQQEEGAAVSCDFDGGVGSGGGGGQGSRGRVSRSPEGSAGALMARLGGAASDEGVRE